jgi:hypothetical protein
MMDSPLVGGERMLDGPQKGETEFQERKRPQTGVWEREGEGASDHQVPSEPKLHQCALAT